MRIIACEIAGVSYKSGRMPIYEYYCPKNNTIYQFFAKTVAQGKAMPKCPDNPQFRLKKIVSAFAIGGPDAMFSPSELTQTPTAAEAAEDWRKDAMMQAVEKEFAGVDENDPRTMGKMLRKMAEATGEKVTDERFHEVVQRLEEGTHPEKLEETLGDSEPPLGDGFNDMGAGGPPKEPKHRYTKKPVVPRRDPKLYDFE